MANSRLSFVIAIRLLTENFNKGANRIKASLLSMQRNFLALASAAGAGAIGLSNFVSKAIEVAKATTQASVALKNVSGSTAAFAENQKWLLDVAKRYGVEINTLTTGFAKFKAAADISSMSLEDQRKIFESVSRASVAFGLSAEDQRGVFMALSQMMSKNKVMAEELRLQLAERMPVAIQAMAKAAGVTVNELDALMKQGKVMSSDVLPKFAEALNELIPNVDTDNLNKSLVDLSNTFTKLIKELDVEGYFKKVVESVTNLLSNLAEHTTAVATAIRVAIAGIIGKGAINIGKDIIADYDKTVSAAVKAIEGGERAIKRVETARLMRKEAEVVVYELEEKKKVAITSATAEEIEQIDVELTRARSILKKKETELYKAEEAQKKAATKASAEEVKYAAQLGATGWTRAMNIISHSAKLAGKAIKAAFMANIWTAAITAVGAIASKMWDLVKAAKQARTAVKNLGNFEATDEMRELDQWSEYLHHSDESVRAGALQKINDLLGAELTFEDDINAAIEKRLRLLAAQQKLEGAESARVKAEGMLNTRNLDSVTKKEWETARDNAIKEAAQARADIKALESPSKKNNITTPVTGGNPVKVEVVNLDAGDVPELEAVAVGQKSADRIVGEAISEAFDSLILKQVADDKAREIAGRRRDTSGDWKLSNAEIMAADLDFNKSKINDLIEHWEETGALMGESLTEAIGENVDLKKALQTTEIKDALTNLRKEMDDAIMNGLENTVSNIDGIVNAFDRLKDAVDEDASAWESLMAVWDLFSSTTQSIIGIIESVAAAKRIQAEMEKAAAAESIAASTGEAAASVGKGVAKQTPGWAALIAVPAAISAIIAAFAMIPKFAKGGIVGGTSTHGDKVLARLNSGEGVLTPDGLESLHDAANPRNARSVKVTGVLTGRGRDLKAIIDAETKFLTRTK